ncbi:MAG: N-6 DNA methylase, partial [Parcubacteria group bacterium]
GFLISAYKHIIKHNSSNFKPEKEGAEEKIKEGESATETVLQEKISYKGDKLKPQEKERIMQSISGYDISPDMVKLSLVNMYLHGFSDPHIYEYDTLGSEKRWDEMFDVIMANPPFMTPKGGVMPHKRFSVQAKRSEVLFVDYILEHLNIKGRAGIIVPEGIIFKGENAYKQLRQMLVEDGLFAVVSLPPGVFNPYSGVKTSILLFDNELANKTDEILFIKIENDGFDLGAQRRKINNNDLPQALEIIDEWKQDKKKDSNLALWVKKDKIAESGDYNLTGERYRETEVRKNQKWSMVALDEICDIYQPKTITSNEIKRLGQYKVFGANGIIGFYDEYNHEDSEVLITCRGATCGTVNMSEPKSWITGNAMVVKPKNEGIYRLYLYYFLRHTDLNSAISGTAQPQITRKSLAPFNIPLPPLDVQKEIVEQIEVKQKAIDAAWEVIASLEKERRYFGK